MKQQNRVMKPQRTPIQQLLQQLDRQKPAKPTIQTIMQPPANVFSIIRQIYNSFKKDNESSIMQNKVYQLKIFDNSHQIKQKPITPVTLKSLCSQNNHKIDAEIIENLIILKSYLPPTLQTQLILHISTEITKIDDLPTVLKSYRKLLKTKQCINDYGKGESSLYRIVEKEMINKLLKFDRQFSYNQIKQISSFICALPYLGIQILQFISKLFENVRDIGQFKELDIIFTNIYDKINSNSNSSSNNKQVQNILVESLMKITTQQNINKVQQKYKKLVKKIQNKEKFSDSNQVFLLHLRQQAIHKLKMCINHFSSGDVDLNLNQKNRKIIDFIFIAIQCQALIRLQQKKQTRKSNAIIWSIFINWHKNCCAFASWKFYIEEKMVNFTNKILENPKITLQTITILLEKQCGHLEKSVNSSEMMPQQQPFKLMQDLNQSVTYYFIRQILSGLSGFAKYLNYKPVRLLTAIGIMHDKLKIYEAVVISTNNLNNIDILIQTFQVEGTFKFYKQLVDSSSKKQIFVKFITKLLEIKPKKFLDLYSKIDQYNDGQIFSIQQGFFMIIFEQNATVQIILAFLRGMTNYLPSKFCIELISRFVRRFKDKPQVKVIKSQATRTLNIILNTRKQSELSALFKTSLLKILRDENILPAFEVFKNVSSQMNKDYSAFYQNLGLN